MAKQFYCNDSSGMQAMMVGGMMSSGMMQGGMMSSYKNAILQNGSQDYPMMNNYGMMGRGMMGGRMGSKWHGSGYGSYWAINALFIILLIGIIIVVYLYAFKLLRHINAKQK